MFPDWNDLPITLDRSDDCTLLRDKSRIHNMMTKTQAKFDFDYMSDYTLDGTAHMQMHSDEILDLITVAS